MKILFLLTQDLDSPAGVGRYFPWARELVRLGHQVSIAALHANYASLERTHFMIDGVEVNYVSQMHVLKQGNLKTYYLAHQLIKIATRASWQLIRAAWKSDADIIQLGKPHPMNGMAGLASRYLKKRLVFLDCDDYEMANIHFGGGWQKVGVHYFENMLPRHVDYVSVHCSFLRAHMLKLNVKPERLIYLPHGTDQLRFTHIDPAKVDMIRSELDLEGKKVITFIGSLSLPSHPVDLLLEAFARVHSAIPESRLLIVGGGEEYKYFVERAEDLGLKETVIFRGRVPGSEVPNYYALADATAEPVVDNPVGRNSLPLKMFESWVAGVPFITQDVGDRKMLLGEPPAGLLAQAGDANSLAAAIIEALTNQELATQLRERGYVQARKYSWESLAKQMEAVYQRSLANKYGDTH